MADSNSTRAARQASDPPDDPRNPHYADFQAGLADGTDFNPYWTPGKRTGDALAAYNAGYRRGLDCMDERRRELEGDDE